MTRVKRILIANRGEIAQRITRTAHRMGLQVVAVHSDADTHGPFVSDADLAVALPGSTSADTYLNIPAIIEAASRSGADSIHPGYGFLSESPDLAEAVVGAGLTWIGPTPSSIRSMALKIEAKRLAAEAGVPLVPGAELPSDASAELIAQRGDDVGYPLLVKASAGGGGKGMRVVTDATQIVESVAAARREATSSFGDSTVFLERYLQGAKHIEVQIFGDTHGRVVHLFERDCSIQRRHQKVIELAPAPTLRPETAAAMFHAATSLARVIGYQGAGTVEFLVADDLKNIGTQQFYFLEMNTRLQVEHAVTEAITDLDLVEWQIRVARGEPLPLQQEQITRHGQAIEVRLYAEDPARGYLPNTGTLARFDIPGTVRTDSSVEPGTVVSAFYDPMLAKVIAHETDLHTATDVLRDALNRADIAGVVTNRESLIAVLSSSAFAESRTSTDFLDQHPELLAPTLPTDVTCRHLAAAAIAATPMAEVPTGWRNVVAVPEVHHLTDERGLVNHEVQVRWTRDGVQVQIVGLDDEITYAVHDETDPTWSTTQVVRRFTMTNAGLTHRYVVTIDRQWLSVADGTCTTQWCVLPRYATGAESGASAGGPTTPVPGTVTMIDVSVGDRVVAGQSLVVLEAMKMEHRILAEIDGIVEQVLVRVGESVEAHTVVAVVNSIADAPPATTSDSLP